MDDFDQPGQQRGARLKLARETRGWSKAQLGRAIGAASVTNDIARYEDGRGMSHERATRIAKALHVHFAWLWNGEGPDGLDRPMPAPSEARSVEPLQDEGSTLTLVIEVARDRGFDDESFRRLADAANVLDHRGGATRGDIEQLAAAIFRPRLPERTRQPEPEVLAARTRASAKGGMRPKGRK